MSGKNNRGGWLKDPRKSRAGEAIGGGHFVFRRGDGSNRIRPSMWPFEYASAEEARVEADRLAREFPGYRFRAKAAERDLAEARKRIGERLLSAFPDQPAGALRLTAEEVRTIIDRALLSPAPTDKAEG